MLERIISGGQTGVDRAALDVAMKLGIDCGGWVPKGRKAEDGPIPSKYPMQEMNSEDYADRTKQNILDSDGTLVLTFGPMSSGTKLTYDLPTQLGKPVLMIDMTDAPDVKAFQDWINKNFIRILNVGGPRESHAPGKIYKLACKTLLEFLY